MCLCPGLSNILIPGTDRAHALAAYVRTSLLLLLLLGVVGFFCINVVYPLVNIISALCGLLAVRHTEGYAFQPVFCFLFSQVLLTIFMTVICLQLYTSGITDDTMPYSLWVALVFYWTAAPLLYGTVVVTTYRLHKELRALLNQLIDPLDDGAEYDPVAVGGAADDPYDHTRSYLASLTQQQQQQPGGANRNSPGSAASQAVARPSPFTGRSHRLD